MKRLIHTIFVYAVFFTVLCVQAHAAPNDADRITFSGFSVFDSPQDVVNKSKDYILVTNIEGLPATRRIDIDKNGRLQFYPEFVSDFSNSYHTPLLYKIIGRYRNAELLAEKASTAGLNHPKFRPLKNRYCYIQLQDKSKKFFEVINFLFAKNNDNSYSMLSMFIDGPAVAKAVDVFSERYGALKTDTNRSDGMYGPRNVTSYYWEKPEQYAMIITELNPKDMYIFNTTSIDAWAAEFETVAKELDGMRNKADEAMKDQI